MTPVSFEIGAGKLINFRIKSYLERIEYIYTAVPSVGLSFFDRPPSVQK
jgi:hypothetical protein